ncbi:hypothetical protein D9757_008458 [Collybiopsis confluens]|uniref:Uncharacterized protein n=1 Tax=Collybiopsis confluens TaxID=2823264 RepID=A0A8H5HFJ9_9AGAR|nr:hypothetical protein D9757_008458 [Collybiopsis confluens]
MGGTWFRPGMGNCGQENNSNDPIVAIPKSLYDENNGSNCGQAKSLMVEQRTAVLVVESMIWTFKLGSPDDV